MNQINRREAVKKTALIIGGTLSASIMAGVLAGCKADPGLDWTPKALNPKQAVTVADLAECILPATQTPGAKDALVDRFVDSMLHEYLLDPERQVFLEGLAWLEKRRFSDQSAEKQNQLVAELAEAARRQNENTNTKPFFLLAKEMILLGFFSSEVGATQVLSYDPIPGGYQGCIPLDELGGKNWAT